MSLAALPYAVLLLLAEFCTGSQLFLYAADLRGTVTRGFVKMSAALVSAGAALALWMALLVAPVHAVAGYALAQRYLTPARLAFAVLLLLTIAYTALVWRERRRAALATGALASLAAFAAMAVITAVVQQPTWSYAGAFLSLLTGGLALGGVTLAMTLGHWYLVTPRLPEQPLIELTLGLLAVLGVQVVLLAINVLAPARDLPPSLGIALGSNPALWLRVGVGLLFPIVLSLMAWHASRERGMMSATGLLYLATGAILAGEALACALLFSTAIPG